VTLAEAAVDREEVRPPTAPLARDSRAIFELDEPVFVLNPPFSLDTAVANNATMEKLGPGGRRIDRARALAQWRALYRHIAARSLVYLLPSRAGLQDQPYVANLGVMLGHLAEPVFVVSRFRAAARGGEAAVARAFFRAMGIATRSCPAFMEGDADCKRLRSNIYFAGFGLPSSRQAHNWLRRDMAAEIVPIPLHDPHLYHLDCVLHVVGTGRVLLATAACPAETVRAVEAVADIIDVPLALAYRGATNVARLGPELLCDSCLPSLKRSDALYPLERDKREFWLRIAPLLGLELVFFDLSEFYKSGAMLSCLVLPLTPSHLRQPRVLPTT
jgi:N-dimethylarginine dimethylaminohydrolase